MSILIVDNYDSFTFNLYQMIQALTKEEVVVFRNDALNFADVKSLKPSKIVLSPGPGHPAIEADFRVCKDIIVGASELACPVLGVCLGHQGMVQHLGGSVVRAPQIVHGKSSTVKIEMPSPLFKDMPESFEAMRYHSLVADEDKFPAQLEIVGRESGHGLIMAIQHRELPMYGVQFHPESIGTPLGAKILENFVGM